MNKIKKRIISFLAAATLASSMAISASAYEVYIQRGAWPAGVKTIVHWKGNAQKILPEKENWKFEQISYGMGEALGVYKDHTRSNEKVWAINSKVRLKIGIKGFSLGMENIDCIGIQNNGHYWVEWDKY